MVELGPPDCLVLSVKSLQHCFGFANRKYCGRMEQEILLASKPGQGHWYEIERHPETYQAHSTLCFHRHPVFSQNQGWYRIASFPQGSFR